MIKTREPATEKTAGKPLTYGAFFSRILAKLNRGLPDDLKACKTSDNSHLLKIYFDNERIHYEVWPIRWLGWIEVGLHFEDGPVSSAAYLHYFDKRIVALKDELGPELDLEQWTASWAHLFYMAPFEPFDLAKADEVSARLIKLISTVQPLVVESGIPAENRERVGGERRYYRNRRRS